MEDLVKIKVVLKLAYGNDKYYLKDRKNLDFRVVPDNIDCQSTIFNAKINSTVAKDIFADSIRIDFLEENKIEEMKNIISTHKSGEKLSGDQYTNGHYVRPV